MIKKNNNKIGIEDLEVYGEIIERDLDEFGTYSIYCKTIAEYNGKFVIMYYDFDACKKDKLNAFEELRLLEKYKKIFREVGISDLINKNKGIKPVKTIDFPENAQSTFIKANIWVIFDDLDILISLYIFALSDFPEKEKDLLIGDRHYDLLDRSNNDYSYMVSRIIYSLIFEYNRNYLRNKKLNYTSVPGRNSMDEFFLYNK